SDACFVPPQLIKSQVIDYRLEPIAIDRSLYCHLPARRKFPARFLRQAQNSPFVDRVQRGVKTNCWHPCALTHSSHIFCSPTTATSTSGPPSPMRQLGLEVPELLSPPSLVH